MQHILLLTHLLSLPKELKRLFFCRAGGRGTAKAVFLIKDFLSMLNGKLRLKISDSEHGLPLSNYFQAKMRFCFSNSGFLSFSIAEVLKGCFF